MTSKNIINFILFQLLWLACVWGAAHQLLWPGLTVFSLLLAWHLIPKNHQSGDIKLIFLCLILGGLLDSAWQASGVLNFNFTITAPLAPIWILLLWMGLALTLNHSLNWLKGKYLLVSLFAGIAAPSSYYAAQRLGAVQITTDEMIQGMILLGMAWAVIFPWLVYLSQRWSLEEKFFAEEVKA